MVDQFGNWRPDYPGQQPFTDSQFIRVYGQPPGQTSQQGVAQAQQQTMTRPTIHAEIIQVANSELGEQEASKYPVGAGHSQMFITQDEATIYIKEATQNGSILNIYPKRPPVPTPSPFNPAEYVRIDDIPAIVAAEVQAALAAMQPTKTTQVKKETEAAAE